MKYIKKYSIYNEEVGIKSVAAGLALSAGVALGSAKLHDTNTSSKEVVQINHVNIPDYFQMKSKIISLGKDMYITNNNGDNLGKVEQRVLSWGKTFQYSDNNNKVMATAKQEVFSIGTKINITDESGTKIGAVEQEIIKSMFSIYSKYSIKDKNGKVIANSKKLDFFTSNVDIFDMSGNKIANFSQKAFTIADKWDCSISNKSIDRRLLIFIPAFISSSQEEKK